MRACNIGKSEIDAGRFMSVNKNIFCTVERAYLTNYFKNPCALGVI